MASVPYFPPNVLHRIQTRPFHTLTTTTPTRAAGPLAPAERAGCANPGPLALGVTRQTTQSPLPTTSQTTHPLPTPPTQIPGSKRIHIPISWFATSSPPVSPGARTTDTLRTDCVRLRGCTNFEPPTPQLLHKLTLGPSTPVVYAHPRNQEHLQGDASRTSHDPPQPSPQM